jgi:AAA family ATP:ADP antiporter
VFNVLVIAQLWAFANDLYTQRQGERLFPLLGFRQFAGRVGRAVAATRLMRFAGPYGLMTARRNSADRVRNTDSVDQPAAGV